jgi:hypothetical protein
VFGDRSWSRSARFYVDGWGLCFDIRRSLGILRQSFYWIIFSSENVTYEEVEERSFLILRLGCMDLAIS